MEDAFDFPFPFGGIELAVVGIELAVVFSEREWPEAASHLAGPCSHAHNYAVKSDTRVIFTTEMGYQCLRRKFGDRHPHRDAE